MLHGSPQQLTSVKSLKRLRISQSLSGLRPLTHTAWAAYINIVITGLLYVTHTHTSQYNLHLCHCCGPEPSCHTTEEGFELAKKMHVLKLHSLHGVLSLSCCDRSILIQDVGLNQQVNAGPIRQPYAFLSSSWLRSPPPVH